MKGLYYGCTSQELRKFIDDNDIITKDKLPDEKAGEFQNYYLYAIKCLEDAYYIGISGADFEARMTKYFRRKKTGNDPKNLPKNRQALQLDRLIDLGILKEGDATVYESALTAEYMKLYGYSKVRGGCLVQKDERNYGTLKNKGYIVDKNDKLIRIDEKEQEWDAALKEMKEFRVIYDASYNE